jgi:hypothetical protein
MSEKNVNNMSDAEIIAMMREIRAERQASQVAAQPTHAYKDMSDVNRAIDDYKAAARRTAELNKAVKANPYVKQVKDDYDQSLARQTQLGMALRGENATGIALDRIIDREKSVAHGEQALIGEPIERIAHTTFAREMLVAKPAQKESFQEKIDRISTNAKKALGMIEREHIFSVEVQERRGGGAAIVEDKYADLIVGGSELE